MTPVGQSTLYIPVASPPTPAPSPGLSFADLPSTNDPTASLSRRQFTLMSPEHRRRFLGSILADCTPSELLFVSSTVTPLLKRDFLRELPPELSWYILSFIDEPQTLARASCVSRYWNRLLSDEGGHIPTDDSLSPEPEGFTPTIRHAIGLDSPKPFHRRALSGVFSSNVPRPKPSEPSGASDGWGQPNALVVSGGCDKDVRVWDAKSGFCIYTMPGHQSTIRCLKVLHNRPIAVTGSRDRTVRVWDVRRGKMLRVLEGHEQSVRCIDVCGNIVVSGSYDTTCRVWNIDTGACIHVLRGHYHQIYTVAFDGVRIASGGLDTTVRVWDVETGTCLALLQGHTALVCQLQLTPTMLATGGSDGRVITFSLVGSSFSVIQRLAAHDSSVTALQLDDRFMVTGGNDGRVRLFQFQNDGDGEPGKCEYVRELSDPSESVWKVAFTRTTCAIAAKKAGKTVVEIWRYRPNE
ncbi:unnamed protein product [Somion occarium]|uniref:F-box domain-containing protein n=1 Tax=Somion occarium TaxID=3059160 RepID=A0ABP1DML5_9APHY